MAIKKYLSLDRLTEYDGLIKTEISTGDASTLASAKSYTDTEVAKKANSSHTHDDRYYTESEIDTKISGVNSTISTHTGNTTVHITAAERTNWNAAKTHAGTTHAPSNAEKNIIVGIQQNGTDLTVDSTTRKVNITVPTQPSDIGAATSGHNHDSKYDAKGAADTALASAKTYTDGKIELLMNNSSDAVDSIMELAAAMEDNADAIGALEEIAGGKADKVHSHAISDVSGLQTALDGKAASSHGTHVTWSTTSPKMNGTAAVGSETKVARGDHVHPTDTSRAAKADFDTHTGNTTVHITSTERTNWNAAYTHSGVAHAPSDAEKNQNAFSNVTVGSTTIAADTVTDTLTIAAGTGISVTADAKNDKVTITNSGVTAIATGTSNGTISVTTNGSTANVSVKGLGSAAYTASTAYAPKDHTHTVDSSLSLTSTNPVQNKVVNSAITTATSAITANTNAISANTTAIGNLQTAVGEFTEITSAEIQALFA